MHPTVGGNGAIPLPTVKVWMGEERMKTHLFTKSKSLFYAGRSVMLLLFSVALIMQAFSSPGRERATGADDGYTIAVFVPGVVAGSPTYEMLVTGVQRGAEERPGASVKVVEGGFNQGDWEGTVTALASSKEYDLIISSNPALPEICDKVSSQFPDQHFLVLDGYIETNERIHTVLYNQMEQAYLIGHMGGLVTTSTMPGANKDLKAGLIAGMEYPIMNRVIRVGFELGLKSVHEDISLDFRVVGNWYDAAKGAELAAGMFDSGTDVILTIAGGANQGVISEARKRGKYVLWFDSNGYSEAPGVVVGSSALNQEQMAYEKTLLAIDGSLAYGTSEIVGVKDGYVQFVEDDSHYTESVPGDIRSAQHALVQSMLDGKIEFTMPVY